MTKKRASSLLLEKGQPLFALFDVSRAGDVHSRCAGAARIGSLYKEQDPAELRELAPHLVAIGADSNLIDRMILAGWGRSLGVYFSCDKPFDVVLNHLRNFIQVRMEDGSVMFFRFYDPRVL